MATLARQHDPFEDDSRGNHPELTFSIPKPFPSRAEREQEELLESLEEEVLNLDEVEASTTKQSLQVEFAARNRAQEMSGTRQRSVSPTVGSETKSDNSQAFRKTCYHP